MVSRYYLHAFVTTRGCEGAENLGIGFDRERRRSIYHCFCWASKIFYLFIFMIGDWQICPCNDLVSDFSRGKEGEHYGHWYLVPHFL